MVGRQAVFPLPTGPPPQGECSPTAAADWSRAATLTSNGQTKPDNAILLNAKWNHRFRPLSEKVRQLACGARVQQKTGSANHATQFVGVEFVGVAALLLQNQEETP